jgi:HEPN domain-containing protein
MAYSVNLLAAARRHLDAAEKLLANKREDVAGYLFGIAAECAVKSMASELAAGRSSQIFYAHFPELRTLLLDALQGRTAQPLRRLIEPGGFMNQWDIKMRYAPADDVRPMPIGQWAEQARRAVTALSG